MDIGRIVEQALDIAVSMEDRALGSRLQQLAEKLHSLYFDPVATRPVLEELAATGRLTSMTRSEALGRLHHSANEVAATLASIENLLKTQGKHLFSPSDYAALQAYGREKTHIRLQISDAINRLITLPIRYANGEEPYEQIKDEARAMLARIEALNEHLDRAFRIIRAAGPTAAAIVTQRGTSDTAGPAAEPKPQKRLPRNWLVFVLLLLALLLAGAVLSGANEAIKEVFVGILKRALESVSG